MSRANHDEADPLAILASQGGPGLGGTRIGPNVPAEVRELLAVKNGFYAFNGALHVFPSMMPPGDLETWNAEATWRDHYGSLAAGHYFFAEDIFGVQFSVCPDGVCTFNPETAETEVVAGSVREWADVVVREHEVLLGSPIAVAWCAKHGPLQPGTRLMPQTLFVLGGAFELSNLEAKDSAWMMQALGPIAQKLVDIPDGTQIVFDTDDSSE